MLPSILTKAPEPWPLQLGLGSKPRITAFKASQVRLSKRNKALMFEYFKGYWIEFGTKGAPKKNIPPQPARPFMQPAYDLNESWILGRVKAGINKALDRASRGAGND